MPQGGANFGWDYLEGTHPFEGSPPQDASLVHPIWEYDHSMGCSVTGGVVFRGALPEWQGIYIYGDYCSGKVWGLLREAGGAWRSQLLYQTNATITSFGEDESGALYLIDRSGTVSCLVESP
jgi:hypothetical protein